MFGEAPSEEARADPGASSAMASHTVPSGGMLDQEWTHREWTDKEWQDWDWTNQGWTNQGWTDQEWHDWAMSLNPVGAGPPHVPAEHSTEVGVNLSSFVHCLIVLVRVCALEQVEVSPDMPMGASPEAWANVITSVSLFPTSHEHVQEFFSIIFFHFFIPSKIKKTPS